MLAAFDVTADERASGALAPERLADAAAALWRDGGVVLRHAIEPDHVETLRAKMEADIPALLEKVDFNMAQGQFHHSPPPFAPFVFSDVVANPLATSLCAAVIGARVQLSFLSGNTNLPGSEAQALHRDLGNLWPALEASHPPAMLSVHIPLVDTDERNGATEVWPGTHRMAHLEGAAGYGLDVDADPVSTPHDAMASPPVAAACPAGGILIRDARAWHRAMPNRSARPRVMLGLVYAAIWQRAGRIPFMRSAEAALAAVAIPLNALYLDEPFDYLADWKTRASVRRVN